MSDASASVLSLTRHDTAGLVQYEMRRDAQEVLPRLWCGPFQSSISLGQLEERKITHILCVAESRET